MIFSSEIESVNRELYKVGIEIEDIYDLVNTKQPYPKAIPVLIKLLSEVQNDGIKEGIIRALAVKEARGVAGKYLIKEYRKIPKSNMALLWAIGNTMEVVISEEDVEGVLEIVTEKQNGTSRQMFVMALGKVKTEKAEKILLQLLDDEEVISHALDALGKMKSQKAKPKISEFLNHQNPFIRKEAQKALKKIK